MLHMSTKERSIKYMVPDKTVYKLLTISLLFYHKIQNNPKKLFFKRNPHEPFVANYNINGT